jgi:hypothetical protein
MIEKRRSREISLVAYHAIDRLVFVRVPNERGRYMLTDQCVALVPCSQCGACVGEPCANRHLNWYRNHPDLPTRYTVSTHVARRGTAMARYGHGGMPKTKVRIAAEDVEAAFMATGAEA